jgi:hypothetical protein
MRMMKLAMLAMAALLLGGVSANAITVKKRTEAPGLPPEVWAATGAFCAIKDWYADVVTECVEEKDGDAVVRVLTLKDGAKLKEKLTAKDDLSYSYEIVEGPLPVKNYKAKVWVEEDDEPDRTVIYWQADFDANGASDDEAKQKITDILKGGVKGIKQAAIAAHDAKTGTAAGDKDKDDDEDK